MHCTEHAFNTAWEALVPVVQHMFDILTLQVWLRATKVTWNDRVTTHVREFNDVLLTTVSQWANNHISPLSDTNLGGMPFIFPPWNMFKTVFLKYRHGGDRQSWLHLVRSRYGIECRDAGENIENKLSYLQESCPEQSSKCLPLQFCIQHLKILGIQEEYGPESPVVFGLVHCN